MLGARITSRVVDASADGQGVPNQCGAICQSATTDGPMLGRCPNATTDARRSATEACSASGEVFELTRDRWLVPSALGARQPAIDAGALCQARQRLSRPSGDAPRVSGFWHSSLASLSGNLPATRGSH